MSQESNTDAGIGKVAIAGRIANYFAGQPFGNMLSTLIICGFGYWFWWSQTIGGPQSAKMIQDGMAAQSKTHADATKSQADATADAVKAQATATADAVKAQASATADSIKALVSQQADTSKTMLEHSEKAAVRREKSEEHKEELLRELFGKPARDGKLTSATEQDSGN